MTDKKKASSGRLPKLNREELLKKDWQILTAEELVVIHSMLRVCVSQNSRIIAKLFDLDPTVVKNEYYEDFRKEVDQMSSYINQITPNYPHDK